MGKRAAYRAFYRKGQHTEYISEKMAASCTPHRHKSSIIHFFWNFFVILSKIYVILNENKSHFTEEIRQFLLKINVILSKLNVILLKLNDIEIK